MLDGCCVVGDGSFVLGEEAAEVDQMTVNSDTCSPWWSVRSVLGTVDDTLVLRREGSTWVANKLSSVGTVPLLVCDTQVFASTVEPVVVAVVDVCFRVLYIEHCVMKRQLR